MLTTQPSATAATLVKIHGPQGIPAPKELERRMLEVRASWDVKERMKRRAEARTRFHQLLTSLQGAEG